MATRMRARRRRAPMRRRRRTFKRKARRYTKPDGYHSEKIVYDQAIKVRDNGDFLFYFTWLKAIAGGGVYGLNQSVAAANNEDKQFSQCACMYREYRVTGVKFVYTPSFYSGFNVAISPIRSGTKVVTADEPVVPSAADIEGAYDNKQFNPNRSFTRYYNVGRWAKSKDIQWQQCEDILSNPPENVPGVDCSTGFSGTAQGFAADAILAQVQVIYYVKFRSRTASTYNVVA